MNENRSEWVRIGAEENDAPWCREFDDRSGIQLVADADRGCRGGKRWILSQNERHCCCCESC